MMLSCNRHLANEELSRHLEWSIFYSGQTFTYPTSPNLSQQNPFT